MAGVQINLTPERARDLQHGLSDIACWAGGYVCALPPEDRSLYAPIGIEEVRDLNIIIKGALSDYEERTLTEEELEIARLRRWLHRIEEACCDIVVTKDQLRSAALAALSPTKIESPDGCGLRGWAPL